MCANDASFLCPLEGYVHYFLPCAQFTWVQQYFGVGGADVGPRPRPLPALCPHPRPCPHRGVGLIGGSEFGGVLCGCGCALVLVDLEARHNLIHDGVGVVESQFVNCSSILSEFKASFTEVVFKVFPCFVCLVG